MNYSDWVKTGPVEIHNDPLWNQEAYRLALFADDSEPCSPHELHQLLELVALPEP